MCPSVHQVGDGERVMTEILSWTKRLLFQIESDARGILLVYYFEYKFGVFYMLRTVDCVNMCARMCVPRG